MKLDAPETKALATKQAAEMARAGIETVKSELFPALTAAFGEAVKELPEPYGVPQLEVDAAKVHAVCLWLKDHGFNMLLDLGGVDYLPREPRFEVVYHLLAVPSMERLRLRVPLPNAEHPQLATVSDLWQSANPAEREVWDQFGIVFKGHPNLTRILNPDDWEGHPLRKDYPLRGERALHSDTATADQNRFHPIKFDAN